MVPVIASSGASFKGAFAYYFHDKNAWTTARVAWTETRNLMTDCADKAWKVMAYTAKSAVRLKEAAGQSRTGRKLEKPVFAYSLAWHPEQNPDKAHMLDAAQKSLEALGLTEHEAMISAHRDEPQPHIHIVVNRVHPLTGMTAKVSHSKRKLSKWASEYEREHGKIYCMKREENREKRKNGQKTKYVDPVINEAWQNSRDAKGFSQLLEKQNYQIAQGHRRLVVVDAHGKAVNPVRHLEGVRASEFNQRMADLDAEKLPTSEDILEARKTKSATIDKSETEPEKAQGELHTQEPVTEPEPTAEKTSDQNISEPAPTNPDKDERFKAFEDRVAIAMNELAGQHYEEWKSMSEEQDQIIRHKRTELAETLRLEDRQEAIDTLQAKLDRPSLLPRFARKIFGTDRKIEEKLSNLHEQQEAAKKRFDDDTASLTKNKERALNQLDSQHAQKKREYAARLKKWRPASLSEKFERSKNDHTQEHSHERANDGPSLGR